MCVEVKLVVPNASYQLVVAVLASLPPLKVPDS